MTQTTLTLADFLLARIAEDKARVESRIIGELDKLARDGLPGLTREDLLTTKRDENDKIVYDASWLTRPLAEHEVKRRIIQLHHSFAVEDDGTPDPYASPKDALWCAGCGFNGIEEYRERVPCPTLRVLALPYADHPDYCGEWRP